jgi:Holliday junction resolvase RusA-like endonuclease
MSGSSVRQDAPTLLIAFTIPGSPVPMERAGIGAQGQRFVPTRSARYRKHVQDSIAYLEDDRAPFDISPRQYKPRPGIESIKLCERVSVHARLYFADRRSRDADNCLKAITDALVKGGFLPDDNFKRVAGMHADCDLDRENPRAEVEIHRAPPLAVQRRRR